MARPRKEEQLNEAHERCVNWGKNAYDRGPDYPTHSPEWRILREREGASQAGQRFVSMSDADWQMDRIVCALPPMNKLIIRTEYAEHGSQLAKARRVGMSLADYKNKLNGALWNIWAWLDAGRFAKW